MVQEIGLPLTSGPKTVRASALGAGHWRSLSHAEDSHAASCHEADATALFIILPSWGLCCPQVTPSLPTVKSRIPRPKTTCLEDPDSAILVTIQELENYTWRQIGPSPSLCIAWGKKSEEWYFMSCESYVKLQFQCLSINLHCKHSTPVLACIIFSSHLWLLLRHKDSFGESSQGLRAIRSLGT